MYQHKNDPKGLAATQGDVSEALFATKLNMKQVPYRLATLREDKYKHNDLYVINGDKEIGIDIKSHKKRYRYDYKRDCTYVSCEISNNYGYSWCMDPKSGYIAFQYATDFYLVLRKDLQNYINDNVDLKQVKIENKQRKNMDESALEHKLFYRYSQPNECITYIKWGIIKQLAKRVI